MSYCTIEEAWGDELNKEKRKKKRKNKECIIHIYQNI